MVVRLSALMFLSYAVLGAFQPVHGPYLESLEFTPDQIAWIFATTSIASLLAPVPWSQIADRWLSCDRCLFLCAAVEGTLLWIAADLRDAFSLFWVRLAAMMFLMPTLSLAPALAFRHLPHPEREFGIVRMWGTLGWMAVGVFLTLWFKIAALWTGVDHVDLSDSLRLAAICGWILAAYCLTLPATPPLHPEAAREGVLGILHRMVDAPLAATGLFRQRAFCVYMICFFGAYVTWSFNLQLTPNLLKSLGISEKSLPLVMTLSQTTEVLTLWMLPSLLRRLGQRRTMIVGISAYAVALCVLAAGEPTGLVIGSLLLHGFYVTCFLVAGQVFVQRIAERHFRASAQGLLVVIAGFAQLLGNLLVGQIQTGFGRHDYVHAFVPCAILVSTLALFFALRFRPHSPPPERIPERLATSPLAAAPAISETEPQTAAAHEFRDRP